MTKLLIIGQQSVQVINLDASKPGEYQSHFLTAYKNHDNLIKLIKVQHGSILCVTS